MPNIKFKSTKEEDEKRYLTLTLMVTRDCNLRCSYCYEKINNNERKYMDVKVAIDAIKYYLERKDGQSDVIIDLFGGEPFLAYPLIKKIFEWIDKYSFQKKVKFSISTNGTILTDEMRKWLIENKRRMTVGFSIDGCKKAHDINRSKSYDSLKKNMPFFVEHWPLQPAKLTVNENTIPLIAESVIHLENLGINFNGGLVLEDIWGDEKRKQSLLTIYEEQLAILIDYYKERPELYPPSPLFPKVPEYLGHQENKSKENNEEFSRFCGAGFEMVCVDIDGSRYPCHRFLPYCTGKQPPLTVKMEGKWEPEKCAHCKLLSYCPTCIGHNFQSTGNIQERTAFHCEAYKIGIIASCKLEAIRFEQMKKNDFDELPEEDKNERIRRLDSVIHIIENGL